MTRSTTSRGTTARTGYRSKKRSGANSTSPPPDPVVFFIDRSLGRRTVADALRHAGALVEIHDDHFLPDALDEEWLGVAGQRRWLVLTKDRRIRYRATALAAIRAVQARVFVLTAGDLQGAEMAAAFVRALPRMTRFATHHPAPFVARVTAAGKVAMLVSARLFR